MKRLFNNKAVSITEAIIASVIFATASAGVFTVVSLMKNSTGDKDLLAARKARAFYDALSRKVDHDEYYGSGSGSSELDPTVGVPATKNLGDGCTATYEITEDGTDGVRNIDLDVTCN